MIGGSLGKSSALSVFLGSPAKTWGVDMEDITQPGGASPNLAARAKAILVDPKGEWPKIAAETESVQSVFTRYVVPLAAIGPVCGFIGGQVFGINALIVTIHPTLAAG